MCAFLASLLLVTGCFNRNLDIVAEEEEPAYRRGQQYLREGRHDEALTSFLRVIEKRRDAPDSHLHVAEIYLEHIEDPIAAVYHYRKFLELHPEGAATRRVEARLETAKKDILRQFPLSPGSGELDRIDLMDRLERASDEILTLKRDLATLRSENQRLRQNLEAARGFARRDEPPDVTLPRSGTNPRDETPTAGANESPETYIVQPGDTLTRISQKLYGTSSRWNDLYQANRDVLPNENALRVGQELRVP